MIKTNKINIILIIILSILLITIISFSFAAFTTRITNNETNTTIATGSGIMEITYSSGENINVPNIYPTEEPFITKEFTITGKNSNEEEMHYHLLLVLDENTFRSSALTFTLESNNEDDNGYTVPDIITQTGIKEGEREIFLGNGMFTPTNNKNKTHSYTLKLYFPKIEHFDHGVDQGKTFKAHIETKEGETYPGYNAEKGVNHPVLFTGMTPVKWDENNIEINTTEDDPDWYDYDEKRWANAKSLDGSYWVWIPRYAYKIETCYHTSGEDCYNLTGKYAGDIDVKFLKSTTNITEDNTIVESTGYEAHVKDTSMHHFLHPAFQFNGEELGFWVAKFEPSVADQEDECNINPSIENCNKTTLIPKTIPNVTSWRYISVYTTFEVSLNLKHETEIYGWLLNELDSHNFTNHEWGATAYLSTSQYGAKEKVWVNSYHEYKTGCAGSHEDAFNETICHEYHTENGQKASTTHNIYGVYDMSGSAYERTISNFNNQPGGSEFLNIDKIAGIENKYINRYYNSPEQILNNYGMVYDSTVYGDAIYETSFDVAVSPGLQEGWVGSLTNSWNNNHTQLLRVNGPWFARGGDTYYASGEEAGLFHFHSSGGAPASYHTFRPVLTPL